MDVHGAPKYMHKTHPRNPPNTIQLPDPFHGFDSQEARARSSFQPICFFCLLDYCYFLNLAILWVRGRRRCPPSLIFAAYYLLLLGKKQDGTEQRPQWQSSRKQQNYDYWRLSVLLEDLVTGPWMGGGSL